MSLKIRMTRGGTKKRPFYSIVVADGRSPKREREGLQRIKRIKRISRIGMELDPENPFNPFNPLSILS